MPFLEAPWDAFLVHPLMAVALFFYSLARDFGLAIILLTIAIRLAVYPLYVTQIRSQRAMQELDPFFVLPVLAGAVQLVASVMAMPAKPVATSDPNARMFQSMAYTFPLMTVFLGASFPAGLTLYWIATTLFQIVQQYFVSGWGQLPKYLPFLRGVATPADKAMKRETAEIVREGRADLERAGARSGGNGNGDGNGDGDTARAGGRRRGRRRGRR